MKTRNKNILIVILIILTSSLLGLFSCTKEYTLPKVVIITIDDAPRFTENTTKMLDILNKHQVKAVFFCIGIDIEAQPEIMLRMTNEGHIVGNHTYTHPNIEEALSIDTVYEKEIIPTQVLIDKYYSLNNNGVKYFRPPYGSLSDTHIRYVESKGYKVCFWDIDASDWSCSVTVEEIISYHKEALNRINKDTVVTLFHLSNNSNIALDSLLYFYKQKNIEVTIYK